MSIQEGTSIDMATISGEDSKSPITFVEDKDAQQFSGLYDAHQEPYFTTMYGKNMGKTDKDISFADDKRIKEIQEYFKNPSELLHSFIGDHKFEGNCDGCMDDETKLFASRIEQILSSLLGTNNVHGVVLNTTASDIESALSKAASYRDRLKIEKKANKDDRMYEICKILLKS